MDDLRRQIDDIDIELVDLLNRRLDIVEEVGRFKQDNDCGVYAPAREKEVLENVARANAGRPLPPSALRAIYSELMSAALAIEGGAVFAVFGELGGPAHWAARERFGASVHYRPAGAVGDVIAAVVDGVASYGVVPAWRSRAAAAAESLDDLVAMPLKICAATTGPAAANGVDASERYVILGPACGESTGDDRTVLAGESTAVVAAEILSESGLTVTVADAVVGAAAWYAEVEGHVDDPDVAAALDGLRPRCQSLVVLGSYPVVPE